MVKLTQESSLFNTRLALKLAVCRNPVSTILSALTILLITQTYLLRGRQRLPWTSSDACCGLY